MAANSTSPLLSTFQKHIEDMRNLVLCKICIKPLYEPYIISCGHTFCYSCLTSWFGGSGPTRKRDKKCPDCRATVRVQPAPNYLLRELSHKFISRTELLPEDETAEEHELAKQAETAKMARDREGIGLFEGAFKAGIHGPGRVLLPIRDLEDGVERCPECAWELEDGMCGHCGYLDDLSDQGFSDLDGMDENSGDSSEDSVDSELDHDDDPVDGDFDERIRNPYDFNARLGNDRSLHLNSTPEPSTDDGSERTRENYGDPSQSDYSRNSTPVPSIVPYRNYSDLDDDDDDGNEDTEMEGFVVDDIDDDNDSNSTSSSVSTIPRAQRPTRVIVSDSDLEESSGNNSDETTDHTARREGADSVGSSDSDDLSDESGNETSIPNNRIGGRGRPLIVDDDGDDEEEAAFGVETQGIMPSPPGYDRPPAQSRASRANHLNHQRATRRGGSGTRSLRGGNNHYHPYQNLRPSTLEILESRPVMENYARRGRPFHPRAALST